MTKHDGFEHVYVYIYIYMSFPMKHGYFGNLAVKLPGCIYMIINDMPGLSHVEILSVF